VKSQREEGQDRQDERGSGMELGAVAAVKTEK
jgi:hypothetical protein